MFEKIVHKIKEELSNCKRPLFFFHDDPDGLASFLLLYRFIREGKGVAVKSKPLVDMKFLKLVEEYEPDKIFVLDIAQMDQKFADAVHVPIVWIDHHDLPEIDNVKYFNPKQEHPGSTVPVTYLCYRAVEQDEWIGMIGCIGDWHMPDFREKFSIKYPDLLPDKIKTAEDALFKTKLGSLVRAFSFILKGKTSDAMKCVKILTRINDPAAILEQKTPAGKFIYKKFDKINRLYEKLLHDALKNAKKSKKMIVFTYKDSTISFTSDLSNEFMHKYPAKVIYIAREKSGEMRGSLRSNKGGLPSVLSKAISGLEGYGGGHENACGVSVAVRDFKQFVENLEREL